MEPVAASVNSGDAYVLVTPTDVFNWVGRSVRNYPVNNKDVNG